MIVSQGNCRTSPYRQTVVWPRLHRDLVGLATQVVICGGKLLRSLTLHFPGPDLTQSGACVVGILAIHAIAGCWNFIYNKGGWRKCRASTRAHQRLALAGKRCFLVSSFNPGGEANGRAATCRSGVGPSAPKRRKKEKGMRQRKTARKCNVYSGIPVELVFFCKLFGNCRPFLLF